MLKFTIPIAPISKKNSQRILINSATGKPFIMPSAKYKQYEKDAARYIPRDAHIKTPVNVKCLFYMPTRRKCDLTNLLEAVDDVMVKAGLLADDDYTVIESHDGSRVLYDKENPRTEVYIRDTGSVIEGKKIINAVEAAEIISDELNIPLYDLVDIFAKIPAANGDIINNAK